MNLKINYKAVALSNIYHGENEKSGIIKLFRTEKIKLRNPIVYESKFKNHTERRANVLAFLYYVWIKIFQEGNITGGRLMNIWNEFSNKIKYAVKAKDKYIFLNRVFRGFDISTLDEDATTIFEAFDSQELLETIRNEHAYLIMLLRRVSQAKKSQRETDPDSKFEIKNFINDFINDNNVEEKTFKTNIINVPYISGNAIGGYLRRLLISDFLERVGITLLDKETYHRLMTGGTLSSLKDFEKHEARENFKNMCPPIELLGSSVGTYTLESSLTICDMRPICIEHGTGDISFWDLLDVNFGTRLDTSKTEKNITIVDNEKKDDDQATQMLYEYEVLIKGTEFQSSFFLNTRKTLVESCFWHMIKLFKENNKIGGHGSRGLGNIDIDIEVSENADKLYLDYLQENKEKIKTYFQVKEKNKDV